MHTCSRCWMEMPWGDREQLYQLSVRGLSTDKKLAQVVAKLKEHRPQLGTILGASKEPAALISALETIARQTQ